MPRRCVKAIGLALACLAACQTAVGQGKKPATGDEDELYSIRCLSFTGPDHMQRARVAEKTLKAVQGLRADQVRVVSGDESSTLYYGTFRRTGEIGKDSYAPDPKREIELIRQLSTASRDSNGAERIDWPFKHATLEPLPTRGAGKPEWDLTGAKGYWAWHVAVFYNDGEFRQRKTAAEEYCKLLRQQGEEAYFHHGAVRSSVVIGLFPKAALQDVQRKNPLTGKVEFVNKIVDPKMQALAARYPDNLENGHRMFNIVRDPQTGQVKERNPSPSFAVKTPYAEQMGDAGGKPGRR